MQYLLVPANINQDCTRSHHCHRLWFQPSNKWKRPPKKQAPLSISKYIPLPHKNTCAHLRTNCDSLISIILNEIVDFFVSALAVLVGVVSVPLIVFLSNGVVSMVCAVHCVFQWEAVDLMNKKGQDNNHKSVERTKYITSPVCGSTASISRGSMSSKYAVNPFMVSMHRALASEAEPTMKLNPTC